MAQSPEYPDLQWMPPASWTNANRAGVQLVVIHTTEGYEAPTSAEDGAAYDQRRTDGTSTHFFHDRDSTVQCVRTEDIAHAARRQGNLRGIQHELCGRAGQGSAGWADAASQGTLRQAARQCARDARKWGIPVRHLTVAEVADGMQGFCGHVDVTYAFPQDAGTHTDPGPTFPWSQFLDMVRAEMEEPMTPDDLNAIEARAQKAARAAIGDFFWDAYHAATADSVYAAADDDTKREWRNARDILRGVLGGPVSESAILGAVGQVDEAVWAAMPDPHVTAAEKAGLLRPLLGDDAVAVGLLLAQSV